MRVFSALHVRDAGPRHRVSAADLDSVHQIEALERNLLDRAEVDRRSVVDADVDTAELIDGLGHRRGHRITVQDVADNRQRLATGLLDLLGRGVDGARKLGMRLSGLGDQSDVRAIGRDPLGDRQPDAAAGAGDKHRLSCECHGATPPSASPSAVDTETSTSVKSSGKFCKNVCPVEPGLPNTVVNPSERTRSWVTSWIVFSPTMASPVPSPSPGLANASQTRAAPTVLRTAESVDVTDDSDPHQPLCPRTKGARLNGLLLRESGSATI